MDLENEIAIVGIGCRFPGADNVQEYWQLLVNGENHVLDIPPERWNNDAFYSDNKDEAGKHYVKKAGLLSRHDEWDHHAFGVSENEAVRIDPQQRYVLECTHMAMEDGGITREQLAGSQTGVYIGVMNDDYKILASADHGDDTNYSATGMSTTIIASRVSFVYNLQGPCMVIDTACSSSMIAIHLGSQAIKTGDCTMAICGGVSSIISPDTFIALCKARMMSPTGQCHTFCDNADGYARGEGCGVVILKTVKQALKDGNKIWGIVQTGSNQDGRVSQPITAPSGAQQEELLRKVYTQYNLDPTTLQYIEAHGTGTPIGDPTEVNALGNFISTFREEKLMKESNKLFDQYQSHVSVDSGVIPDKSSLGTYSDKGSRDTDSDKSSRDADSDKDSLENNSTSPESSDVEHSSPDDSDRASVESADVAMENKDTIPIGSVKSNIGHTESAAGVAGLIKVLLMMANGKLVASLHVKKDKSNLNKKIELQKHGLDISLEVADWKPNDDGDRVCCVNSFGFGGSNSHAIVIQHEKLASSNVTKHMEIEANAEFPYKVVCVSAMDKPGLIGTMEKLRTDITDESFDLKDISYTSVFHRSHLFSRTLLFGKDESEIADQLSSKLKSVDKLSSKAKTNVVFVFCGVGTTWTGMCREMMDTQPVFRQQVLDIDKHLEPLTQWTMSDYFTNDTDYSDPFLNHIAIFTTQVALFALWSSWGITPDTIIGQSVGEVAAAFASGALTLGDAVRVIYHRSKILAGITGGKMMVVGNYALDKIEDMCAKHDNKVTIAVYNSPTSCTLSGDADIMEVIENELKELNSSEELDIMIRPLSSVQCAYHSHHVDSCLDTIVSSLDNIEQCERYYEHISTVTGEYACNDDFQTGTYWAENIRRPVRFMDSVLKSAKGGVTNVFVEVGPRQVLRAHLPNILGDKINGKCVPSMNAKKECISMYSSLSELYEMGVDIKWNGVHSGIGELISVPSYVFNKTKMMYLPDTAQQFLKGIIRGQNSHMYVRPNGGDRAEFRIDIDKDTTPFVFDHYFINAILVPGATYVEAAFEVGVRKTVCNSHEISVSIEFINPFTPSEDKQYQVEVAVNEDTDCDLHRFEMIKDGRPLCKGTIQRRNDCERPIVDMKSIKNRCNTYRTKEESYECLDKIEFNYGESLSLIEQSWATTTECLAEFQVPYSIKEQTKSTHLHPSIIDAMLQTFGILSTVGSAEGPTLPKGIGSVVLNRPPQERMFCYSQMVKATTIGNHYNCLLLSPEGFVIAEIKEFYTKTMRISDAPNQSIVYDLMWNEVDLSEVAETNSETDKDGENSYMQQQKLNAKLIVFGTRRFINGFLPNQERTNAAFYEMNDSLEDTEAMFRMAIDQIPNMKAVIFAASHHIQNVKKANAAVLENASHTFLCLSALIRVLNEMNIKTPIYAVTEDVIASPALGIGASNVCGAEMWGMVRSAMGETAYHDIRLVDMALSEDNMAALSTLIANRTDNRNEYLIDEGRIFSSEMIEAIDQDHEHNQREMDFEDTDELTLRSANPTKVLMPHFQFVCQQNTMQSNKTAQTSSTLKVRLQSVCLHDSALYPTSTEADNTEHTIWPDNEESGFQVVALEGRGWQEDKNKRIPKNFEKTSKLCFCYPVDVGTTVAVPAKCTFDASSYPFYVPGTVTVGIVLWNVFEACKQSASVYMIVDDDASLCSEMTTNMISKCKKTQLVIHSKADIGNDSMDSLSSTSTVVILSQITQNEFMTIRKSCLNIQRVVALEQYFPRSIQRWAQHNIKGLQLVILNTEKMFSHSELIDKVPRVLSWLKTIDGSLKGSMKHVLDTEEEQDTSDSGMLDLPYPVLSMKGSKHSSDEIPLKVFRTEIFRKDSCYVLVGGLTGLGWELLQVMAELGAGHIATLSRRPPTEEKTSEILNIQNRYSCKIVPIQADITDIKLLRKGMQELQSQTGNAKIRGIFHGGGVVCDKLLSNMSREDVEKPLLPKILGTWNLHTVSLDLSLDFFVMHSSIVAILGNPGQCNYAAGNSFQDSFAHYRRSLGLCGQSINWSTLALGMAAENKELEQNFRSQGFFYLNTDDVRSCFIRAVMTNPPQVTFGIFDWGRLEFHPTVKMYPYKFVRLLDKYGTKNQGFKKMDSKYSFDIEEFQKLDAEGQRTMIVDLLKAMIADSFVVQNESLDEESRFVSLGIDSMAAMSFTNSVFEATQVRIPVVTLLSDTTSIGSVTTHILENIYNGTTGEASSSVEDSKELQAFLNGSVTFMQKSLLDDFVKNPHSKNFMRQADYEVKGLHLKLKDWKVMLKHLLGMNPELRRIYKLNKEEGGYESFLLPAEEVDVDVEVVPFDSICNDNATDDRDKIFFDLTKDLPIRFKIACKKDKTRMRMYIHSVISDLSGVAMLFRDIGSYMKPYICNEALPEKDTTIIPAEAVRMSLRPRMGDMRQYWRLQLAQNIQPFTFSDDIDKELDENNWYQISQEVPDDLVDLVFSYIQKHSTSLYNFSLSVYMALLHQKTSHDLIPLVTNTDMRGHVPQLKSFVTRCINAMPVIGDLRNQGTVKEYLTRSADRLHTMTQQAGYPYELIQDEIQTEELKKHIGRHRIVMDNMANLNQTFKHKRVTIKLSNVFHTRHVYESTMYIKYDLQEKKVEFEYGYNADAVSHEDASTMPMELLQLMKTFIDNQDASIASILAGDIPTSVIDLDNRYIHNQPTSTTSNTGVKDVSVKQTGKMAKGSEQGNGSLDKYSKSSGNLDILHEGSFLKQTSQGWDHSVHVTLARDTSIKENGELLLQWSKSVNDGRKRSLHLAHVSEVNVKQLNGLYAMMLKTANRWIVLKSPGKAEVTQWMNTLKTVTEEQKRRYENENEKDGPLIHHL